MKITILKRFANMALCCSLALLGMQSIAAEKSATKQGYVYTLNNDLTHNGIAVFHHTTDGALREVPGSPFPTGGKGTNGGDIDEQGAIRTHGKFVLAVNPGSHTIAVLQKMDKGELRPVHGSPFPSGGSTPLSIAVHGDLVYVANQAPEWAKPTVKPNITGFRLLEDGHLESISGSTMEGPVGQGPAQIEFSPDGRTLVVTAGFQDEKANRIYSYKVLASGKLMAGPGSPAMTKGASGTVGYSWLPSSDRILVSNFRGSAITVFDINSTDGGIAQKGGTYGNGEAAACWTAISADGKTLYVANFVSNSVSTFDVATDGRLLLLGNTPRRDASDKPDTKDLVLSQDGKHLYVLGSGQKQLSVFNIGSDRLPVELPMGQSPLVLTKGQNITGLATD